MDKKYEIARKRELFDKMIVDGDILKLDKVKKYCQALIKGTVKREIELVFDSFQNAVYTNGTKIVISLSFNLINFFNGYGKLMCIIGLLAHELAHIKYLDFQKFKEIHQQLYKKWSWYGAIPRNKEMADKIERLCEQSSAVHRYMTEAFHSFNNILADVHDEGCMFAEMPDSILTKALCYPRFAMDKSRYYLDEIILEKKLSKFGICTEMILNYVRFGYNLLNDGAEDNPEVKKYLDLLVKVKDDLDCGVKEHDTMEKISCINNILVEIFIFVFGDDFEKEEEREESNQPQGNEGQENAENSGQSQGNEGQENAGKSGQDQGNEGQENAGNSGQDQGNEGQENAGNSGQSQGNEGQENAGNSGQSQGNEGQENAGNSGQGQNDESQEKSSQACDDGTVKNSGFSDSDLKNIEEQIKKAEKELKETVERVSPQKSPEISNQENCGYSPKSLTFDVVNINDMDLDKCMFNGMKDLQDALGKAINDFLANVYLNDEERKRLNELNSKQLDLDKIHSGVTHTINRVVEVSENQKEEYKKIYSQIKTYSNAMQRKVMAILKDRREGGKVYGLYYGKRFEDKKISRIDGCYFSKNKIPTESPTIAVSLLIDESGSMFGERIGHAKRAAILLEDFARGLNIPMMIYGHTERLKKVHLNSYAEFRKIDKNDRYRLVQINSSSCNRDGYAMKYMVEALKERREDVKMLFIISDGLPYASDYAGEDAIKDMKNVIAEARKNKIMVFAAAIGDDRENISKIYGNGFLNISDLEKLPKKFVELIKKNLE